MFDWLSSPEAWVALLTLTLLEIVLGIDNIIFISIVAEKLPKEKRGRARVIGLALAMILRVALLLGISWVMNLKYELLSLDLPLVAKKLSFSGKDLILIGGGLFLLFKSTREIHEKIEGDGNHGKDDGKKVHATFFSVLAQIAMLDVIFSLDSVITAVGMAKDIPVMIIAVIIAVLFMMIFAKTVSDFINKHPTLQMLALSFLILIGVSLIGEGFTLHIPKGYIYFAMAFSLIVEILNTKLRQKTLAKRLAGK